MNNIRTTLSGVLAASGQILILFGVPIEVSTAISTLGLFLMGLFSKDAGKSGTEF